MFSISIIFDLFLGLEKYFIENNFSSTPSNIVLTEGISWLGIKDDLILFANLLLLFFQITAQPYPLENTGLFL